MVTDEALNAWWKEVKNKPFSPYPDVFEKLLGRKPTSIGHGVYKRRFKHSIFQTDKTYAGNFSKNS